METTHVDLALVVRLEHERADGTHARQVRLNPRELVLELLGRPVLIAALSDAGAQVLIGRVERFVRSRHEPLALLEQRRVFDGGCRRSSPHRWQSVSRVRRERERDEICVD